MAVSESDPSSSEPLRRRTVAAVVLAAGAGTRFAGDEHKLLTPIDGVPIVRRSIDAARAAGFDEVVVVSGAIDLSTVVPDDVTLLHNERWEDGQATSLQAAVAYADARGHGVVVVGLGDTPGVSTEVWRAVGAVDADLAAARYAGLALLAITVGKVLVVDLATVERAWRVASFFASGLLLVGTSILYSKLRPRLLAATGGELPADPAGRRGLPTEVGVRRPRFRPGPLCLPFLFPRTRDRA